MSENFEAQLIKNTFKRVLHVGSNKFVYDGSGSFNNIKYSGSFYGDGSNLTNIANVTASYITDQAFSQSANTYTGSYSGSFSGDGSNLTGVTTTTILDYTQNFLCMGG